MRVWKTLEKPTHAIRTLSEIRTQDRDGSTKEFAQGMTRTKLKWDYYEVLLHSQDVERHAAATDREIADELCDHISASIQWMDAMGFDVESVYAKRVDEKAPEFKSIIAKYKDKLSSAIEQAKEAET